MGLSGVTRAVDATGAPSSEASLRAAPGSPTEPGAPWYVRYMPARLRRAGAAVGAGISLLALTGVLVVASAPFLGLTASAWRALAGISLIMVVLVAVSLSLPWWLWSPWWTLTFPVAGLAVLATFGLMTTAVATAYVGVIPLWFLYTGLFHRMRAGAMLVPVAWVTYLAMVGTFSASMVVRLVISGAVWFGLSGILAVMSSQQRLVTEHLETASHTDPLTGLGNRRSLDRRLAGVTAGDCVVICDLDLFKSINDAFGHAAGDEVLAQFGATVNQHMRRRDYAARYGGEEFVLILVRTDPTQALAALASLRTEWLDLGAGVTFSAGLAVVVGDRTPHEVLADADAALFDAKAAGRDCFRLAPAALRRAG